MNPELQNAINAAAQREWNDDHLDSKERRALVSRFEKEMPEVGVLDPELASLDAQYMHILDAYANN